MPDILSRTVWHQDRIVWLCCSGILPRFIKEPHAKNAAGRLGERFDHAQQAGYRLLATAISLAVLGPVAKAEFLRIAARRFANPDLQIATRVAGPGPAPGQKCPLPPAPASPGSRRNRPAEIGDAVGCHDRMLGVADSQERDVKGPAAEVRNEESALDAVLPVLAVAVGNLDRGCRRFVRQAEHFETCGPRSLFSKQSLPLARGALPK